MTDRLRFATAVALGRGGGDTPSPAVRSWARALLGVPLLAKVGGANLLVVLAAAGGMAIAHRAAVTEDRMLLVMYAALALGFVVNVVLVVAALSPLGRLEETARAIWEGDLTARVRASPFADRDVARIGRTLNILLDGLAEDRERMRRLASQVIGAGDEERARIARELHDSTAQTLAALCMQLGAAARVAAEEGDAAAAARMEELRRTCGDALEEVRTLAHTVHPRVLDDLGLVSALEWLGRQTREHTGLKVQVDAPLRRATLPRDVQAALYRVAQEALRNATRHAQARAVRVTLDVRAGVAVLGITDDGIGFDVEAAERRRPGMGLFSMRERVALAHGSVNIDSAPGSGTRITASVPVEEVRPDER